MKTEEGSDDFVGDGERLGWFGNGTVDLSVCDLASHLLATSPTLWDDLCLENLLDGDLCDIPSKNVGFGDASGEDCCIEEFDGLRCTDDDVLSKILC